MSGNCASAIQKLSSPSRTDRRPRPAASRRTSAPKTNKTRSRWHTDRRRAQRSGGGGKTQIGDAGRSGRAIHRAKLHRAIPNAKRRRSSRRYEWPRRAIPCHRPIRRLHHRVAPAPELRSMQRRLRSPLRDKPISLYSWRAPKTTSPQRDEVRAALFIPCTRNQISGSANGNAARVMNNNSCARLRICTRWNADVLHYRRQELSRRPRRDCCFVNSPRRGA